MEYRKVRLSTGLFESVTLTGCEACGVLVWDTDTHDEFHDRLSRTAANAANGDSAYWLSQPLG